MSFLEEKSLILAIFIPLVLNVFFKKTMKKMILASLMQSDEEIFLGYSMTSKAFRVFSKRIVIVKESIHVIFDESNFFSRKNSCDDIVGIFQENINDVSHDKQENKKEMAQVVTKEEE